MAGSESVPGIQKKSSDCDMDSNDETRVVDPDWFSPDPDTDLDPAI
jgi:hypothetical protein